MASGKVVFFCVALGILFVPYGTEGLHLKGPGISYAKSRNSYQKRIYHSPTVKEQVPGPPSPPYLEKLMRLVSREKEVAGDVQKWRNLKDLDKLERELMGKDDEGYNEEETFDKGSDDEYNDMLDKTNSQGMRSGNHENRQFAINRREDGNKLEDEDEEEKEDQGDDDDQEDEKEEEYENSEETIGEGSEESKEKDNVDGMDGNIDKDSEKRRLLELLLRELKNLKKN